MLCVVGCLYICRWVGSSVVVVCWLVDGVFVWVCGYCVMRKKYEFVGLRLV